MDMIALEQVLALSLIETEALLESAGLGLGVWWPHSRKSEGQDSKLLVYQVSLRFEVL